MQYEKAYAELIVFGGGDVITTSRGPLDSSEEWDFKDYSRPTRPEFYPGRPGGGHHRN